MKLTFDGRELSFKEGQTVLDVARDHGIYIPTLCWHARTGPASRCRACVVEIEGMRGMQTSCSVPALDGMVVRGDAEAVVSARRTIVENLIGNGHHNCMTCQANGDCELQDAAYWLGIREYDIIPDPPMEIDDSSPFIVMNPNKCILCGRCVEGCNSGVVNEVLTIAERGYASKIVCDTEVAMGESSCVQCGECVQLCPTAAIVEKGAIGCGREWELEQTDTTCPYCGVGCQTTLHVNPQTNSIVKVTGREVEPNQGRLCVKGRFGNDFVSHPERLNVPLIKQENGEFAEASWDEALDLVAEKFAQYKGDKFAAISSARMTNEDNYMVHKFTRAVMETNNIDHCARL